MKIIYTGYPTSSAKMVMSLTPGFKLMGCRKRKFLSILFPCPNPKIKMLMENNFLENILTIKYWKITYFSRKYLQENIPAYFPLTNASNAWPILAICKTM